MLQLLREQEAGNLNLLAPTILIIKDFGVFISPFYFALI